MITNRHNTLLAVAVLTALGCGSADLVGPGADEAALLEDGTTTDGTDAGAVGDGDQVTVDTIFGSPVSGIVAARHEVITSQEAWQAAWAEVMQNTAPTPELPDVDFTTTSVALVAMGERPSGGYQLELVKAEAIEGGVLLGIDEVSPGPGCVTATVLTQPALLLAIPASGDEVEFETRQVARDCG